MTTFLTIAFASVVAWYLFVPHLRSSSTSIGTDESALVDHKNRCVQVLKDLELDYSTEKISEEDYKKTRLTLERELASILEKLES